MRFPKKIFSILIVLMAGAFFFWSWARPGRIVQPIAFNHRIHVSNVGLDCSICHTYYSQGVRSGLPDVETCMACHSEPLKPESSEEAKFREQFRSGQPIVFRKLFHLPSHVYYSHRRHVVLGKLKCTECHGDIANTQAPPLRPLVQISMDFCIQCHRQTKVTNDCKSCHR